MDGSHNWQNDYVAGGIAGFLGVLASHPFDTIKVRQQTMNTNLWTAVRRTYVHEGVRGYFKGMLFPLLLEGPTSSVFFGFYGNTLRILQGNKEITSRVKTSEPDFLRNVFYAGALTGIVYSCFQCPVELVKTVLQVNTEGKGHWKEHYIPPYQGMWSAISGIVKSRGISGLFRGLLPTICREVPTNGFYMLIYEFLNNNSFQDNSAHWRHGLSGGIAGVATWTVVYPTDVIKSKIQADNPCNPKYLGMIDCFQKIYRNEGISVFMKGYWMSNTAVFVTAFVTFVTYEQILTILNAIFYHNIK